MITEKIKPTAKNNTTNGSTLKPCASSVNNFIIVDEEPPNPADLVLNGVAVVDCAFLSAVDFLLTALLKPPGAWLPDAAPDDYNFIYVSKLLYEYYKLIH